MKCIKKFDDRDNFEIEDFSYLSDYIREEVNLGNTVTYPIEHHLYKSGDYICSSFKIDNRDVIVSSIIISDDDMICVNGGRHYNTLGDYLIQFGIKTDTYLYVGFGEYKEGMYNDVRNVNDNGTLFRKMSTIIKIIKDMVKYHNINYIIFNSVENDLESGLKKEYNKRDKFYELFLAHNNLNYRKIKQKIDVNGEIISDFYIITI